jgi:hypothetical protein
VDTCHAWFGTLLVTLDDSGCLRQIHSAVTMVHIRNLLDTWLECVLIKKKQAKHADVENDQNKN